MRMFGPKGNPTAVNLFGVISALQERTGVHLEVRAVAAWCEPWRTNTTFPTRSAASSIALAQIVSPVHLDPEILDDLSERAEARGKSLSELVNELLRKDIEVKQPKVDKSLHIFMID
jgi:Ribbon-helix-helix protein, copG family